MRILVLQETDWLERNAVLHHRMMEDLSARGHDVVVIDFDVLWSARGRFPLLQRRRVEQDVRRWSGTHGVEVRRPAMLRLPVLARLTWLLGNALELRRLRHWRPDVVVAYGISNALLAQRWAERHGLPFVYHVLDALHTLAEPAALGRVAKPVERAVLSRASHVVPVNRALADYVVRMGARPERVTTIPMGVEHHDVPEDADALRRRLGFGADDVVLLFMGWLYTFSGIGHLARQLAASVEQHPDVRLLVVGDGDLLPELHALAQSPALRGRLVLTGRRPAAEMPDHVAASDLCLLPSDDNLTMRFIVPAKVVEYMQAGRPVLATPLPGLRAEFGDLPGLLWVRGPAELLVAVQELGETPSARRARARELGRSVREAMRSRPDWAEVTDSFEEVLRAL